MSKQVKKYTRRRRNTNKKHTRRRNTNKKHRNRKKGRGIFNKKTTKTVPVTMDSNSKEEIKKKMKMKKSKFENAIREALVKKDTDPKIPSEDIYITCTQCSCNHCNKIIDIFKKLQISHKNFYDNDEKNIPKISKSTIKKIKSADYNVQLKCENCNNDIDYAEGTSELRNRINIDLRKKLYKFILYNIINDNRFDISSMPNQTEFNEFYYIYSNDDYLKYILPVFSRPHPSDELPIDDYYHDAILNFYNHFEKKFN